MESRFGDVGKAMMTTFRRFAAAIFPHFCCGCGREGTTLCPDCRTDAHAPLEGIFVCPGCGDPTPFGANCGRGKCRAHPLDGVISLATYGDPVLRALVGLYKYERVDEAGDALETLFRAFFARHRALIATMLPGAIVTPVPLHFFREALRGFNQSDRFAAALANFLGSPPRHHLRRRFRMSPQAALEDHARRRANARGSVAVRPGARIGERYVLVDDVATSGATLAECARVLKRAGAKKVWAITLLRG